MGVSGEVIPHLSAINVEQIEASPILPSHKYWMQVKQDGGEFLNHLTWYVFECWIGIGWELNKLETISETGDTNANVDIFYFDSAYLCLLRARIFGQWTNGEYGHLGNADIWAVTPIFKKKQK